MAGLKFTEQKQGKGGKVKYVKAKELAEAGTTGVIAEGIYVGTTPNQFNDAKPNIKIESLEVNADGERDVTIVNAAGNLNYRMADVAIGTPVQIHYLGTEKIKSTNKAINGKMSHQFKVLTAE